MFGGRGVRGRSVCRASTYAGAGVDAYETESDGDEEAACAEPDGLQVPAEGAEEYVYLYTVENVERLDDSHKHVRSQARVR